MVRILALLLIGVLVSPAPAQSRLAKKRTPLPPGAEAPDFTAQGIDGKQYALADISKKSKVVVVCFTSIECPLAAAYDQRFVAFNKKYKDKGVAFIGLNCYTKTNLEEMKKHAKEKGYNFAYAFDKNSAAVLAYGAKVTPELFVVKDGKIAYHGAFDNELNDPDKHFVADAVEALLRGEKPKVTKSRPIGCRIEL